MTEGFQHQFNKFRYKVAAAITIIAVGCAVAIAQVNHVHSDVRNSDCWSRYFNRVALRATIAAVSDLEKKEHLEFAKRQGETPEELEVYEKFEAQMFSLIKFPKCEGKPSYRLPDSLLKQAKSPDLPR